MIELQHLTKRFATQGGTVVALNDINLTIRDATSTASSVCRARKINAGTLHQYAGAPGRGKCHRQRQADARTCAPPTCAAARREIT